jgi:hypothetical protein
MLTLQYIPFHELQGLTTPEKIRKILKSVKEDKIILVDGKLAPMEESELIKATMEQIDRKFKGIEICSVDYQVRSERFFDYMKRSIAHILLNKNAGVTVIGPASVVKEIRKDPNKIELFTKDKKRKR